MKQKAIVQGIGEAICEYRHFPSSSVLLESFGEEIIYFSRNLAFTDKRRTDPCIVHGIDIDPCVSSPDRVFSQIIEGPGFPGVRLDFRG